MGETEQNKELTEKQRQKAEEQHKKFMKSMISREEAMNLAKNESRKIGQTVSEFLKEPLMAGLVQTLALAELLKDKGITTDEELQKYIGIIDQRVRDRQEEDTNVTEEKKESGERKE